MTRQVWYLPGVAERFGIGKCQLQLAVHPTHTDLFFQTRETSAVPCLSILEDLIPS